MFKTVVTLFRGSVAAAGVELEDRTALLILDQQMRDAAAAVERSKRTLALAIAQDQQEGRKLEATVARIADLERRAVAALDGGREDLAKDAAEAIAGLEADRDAAMTARALFATEITRLKRHVAAARAASPSSTAAAASPAPRRRCARFAVAESRQHVLTNPRCRRRRAPCGACASDRWKRRPPTTRWSSSMRPRVPSPSPKDSPSRVLALASRPPRTMCWRG